MRDESKTQQLTGGTSDGPSWHMEEGAVLIERFEIVARLGTGSHGAVYRAFDRASQRHVALKTLLQASPEHIVRFKHEFRSLTDLVDPNLVLLYELFVTPVPFFTMELIEGETLRQYVRPDGVLSEARCRHALTQLVKGLATLHRHGRLHRDVKPSNVLVRADGVTKLADFGLTRRMTGLDAQDEEAGVAGTPAFMSPEQAADLPLTPASDLYSVGAVLYELLCGEHPFADLPMLAMMMAKQGGPPPKPSECADAPVPADLEAMAMALLQREPELRPTAPQLLVWLKDGEDAARQAPAVLPLDSIRVSSSTPRRPSLDASMGPAIAGTLESTLASRDGAADFSDLAAQRDQERVAAWGSDGPLIGRAMESSLLRISALSVCRGGNRGAAVCFVHGPSGSGKTALLDGFAGELLAEHGTTRPLVLRGRCYEREQVPFKGVDGLFDAIRQVLVDLRSRGWQLPVGAALARLFPVLVDFAAAEPPASLDPIDQRRAAFVEARALLEDLASDDGLVVVLDDMQWCDLDSAELLADLLRGPGLSRTFTVLGYRDESDVASPTPDVERSRNGGGSGASAELELLRQACGGEGTGPLDVPLRPLSVAEGSALARTLGVPAARCEFVAAEAMGNPLFIHELSRFLREGVQRTEALDRAATDEGSATSLAQGRVAPSSDRADASAGGAALDSVSVSADRPATASALSLDALIVQRASALPTVDVRVLEYVCAAGRPIALDVVLDALHTGPEGHDAIARLRGQHLVRTRGGGVVTEVDAYHDRIRVALLSTRPRAEVAAMHRTLASTLESRQADAELLLFHYEAAGDVARAADLAIAVARRADRALAFHRAAQLYGRSRELLGDKHPAAVALAAAQAEALANDGRGAAAGRIFLQAAAMAPAPVARSLRRRAADQLLRSGRHEEGMPELRRVLAELGVPLRANSLLSAVDLMVGRARVAMRTRGGKARWTGAEARPRPGAAERSDAPRPTAAPDVPDASGGQSGAVLELPAESDQVARVDATFSAAINLSSVNLILGQDLQSRHLLAAMELGEPRRLLRALAMETLYSATSGELGRARTASLIASLAELSERSPDPYSRNMVELAIGVEEVYRGHFARAHPRLLAVCSQLRRECTGVEWEIGTARTFAMTAMFYLGHFREMDLMCRETIEDAIDRDDLHAEIMTRMAYGILVSLALHDVALASDELASCIERGRGLITAATFEYIWMLTESRIHRCAGRPLAAQAAVESRWPALRRSMMLTKQPVRIYSYYERGLTALHAMSVSTGRERAALLARARKTAAKLAEERSDWGRPLAALLLASIACFEDRPRDALAQLVMAENRFRTLEMRALAAAARLRRAELLSSPAISRQGPGPRHDERTSAQSASVTTQSDSARVGEEGSHARSTATQLRRSAIEELAGLGVVSPIHFADLLAPPMRVDALAG